MHNNCQIVEIPIVLSLSDHDDFEHKDKHVWIVKKPKDLSSLTSRKKRLGASGLRQVLKRRSELKAEKGSISPMAEKLQLVMENSLRDKCR